MIPQRAERENADIAQADASDQDALALAAENADEAGAAANLVFVNADAVGSK
jgi:hypothetical protein